MSKIELTIANDYVPSWTIIDAIRELFQNALDQEIVEPSNVAVWHYDEEAECFMICNKSSKLTAQTLLFGYTNKASDVRTVGSFGEGYKIAALVLLRNGKQMSIYNYGLREIWTPRMVKSRRFGTDILTFLIEKKQIWDRVPDSDLTIMVHGISKEEWEGAIVPSNLHLQHNYEVLYSTKYGEILSGKDQAGKIYVNGLYVCKYDPYRYGYNFKPGQLNLDRDRKLVSDFDLRWLSSKMWADHPDVIQLVEQGLPDVMYVGSQYNTALTDVAFERFRMVHGPNAVPVTTQEELLAVPRGYVGLIVPSIYRDLITRSNLYTAPPDELQSDATPLQRLWAWFETYRYRLGDEAQTTFIQLYNEINT